MFRNMFLTNYILYETRQVLRKNIKLIWLRLRAAMMSCGTKCQDNQCQGNQGNSTQIKSYQKLLIASAGIEPQALINDALYLSISS